MHGRSSGVSSNVSFTPNRYDQGCIDCSDWDCPDWNRLCADHCSLFRVFRAALFVALLAGSAVVWAKVPPALARGVACSDVTLLGVTEQAICRPAASPAFAPEKEAVITFGHDYCTAAYRFEGVPPVQPPRFGPDTFDFSDYDVKAGEYEVRTYSLLHGSSIDFNVKVEDSTQDADFHVLTAGNLSLFKEGKAFNSEISQFGIEFNGTFSVSVGRDGEYALLVQNSGEGKITVKWDLVITRTRLNISSATRVVEEEARVVFSEITSDTWIAAEATENFYASVHFGIRLPSAKRSAILAVAILAPVLVLVSWAGIEIGLACARRRKQQQNSSKFGAETTPGGDDSTAAYHPPSFE